MDQPEESDSGPIGSDDPIPHHVMPMEKWERMQAEMSTQQK